MCRPGGGCACAGRRFQPELIYERYNLYFLAGTLVARRSGVPLFLEVNAPLAEERSRHGGLGLPWLARWLERFVWRSADRVLAVTGVLKAMIAAAGVPPERIEVVPNGIDPARFAALPARPEAPDPVVLGFVGFVRDWHGLDAVIAAMAADPRDAAGVGGGWRRTGGAGTARTGRGAWAWPIGCASPGWLRMRRSPGWSPALTSRCSRGWWRMPRR